MDPPNGFGRSEGTRGSGRNMNNFIPDGMKEPRWLAPLCVVTFTIGVFILTLLTTELAPDIRERATARGLAEFLTAIAILNIASPIAALFYFCAQQDSAGTRRL